MAPAVFTPVEGFTGTVVGVHFQDGAGETDDAAALGYFQSAGYRIKDDAASTVPPAGTPLTPDEVARVSGDTGQSDGSNPPQDQGQTPPNPPQGQEQTTPEPPKKPYPQANKAEWFDYLEKVKPGHGLTIENTKADIIAATGASSAE